MLFVEGGSFEMGSDKRIDTMPMREVTLSDYFMSKYPVTQAQWVEVMGYNPSDFDEDGNDVLFVSRDRIEAIGGEFAIELPEETAGSIPIGYVPKDIVDECPVVNVSWGECVEFCNALNKRYGHKPTYVRCGSGFKWMKGRRGFRLPTEAEWEFAARGRRRSNGFLYSGSNKIDAVGWTGDNSGEYCHRVGELMPNELGLYDMSGNVYEWCWDRYGLYSERDNINPCGSVRGRNRVLRGGSFAWHEDCCAVFYRLNRAPSTIVDDYGFRLVFSM